MAETEDFLKIEQTKAERPFTTALAFLVYVIAVLLIACIIPIGVAVWRWAL